MKGGLEKEESLEGMGVLVFWVGKIKGEESKKEKVEWRGKFEWCGRWNKRCRRE